MPAAAAKLFVKPSVEPSVKAPIYIGQVVFGGLETRWVFYGPQAAGYTPLVLVVPFATTTCQ